MHGERASVGIYSTAENFRWNLYAGMSGNIPGIPQLNIQFPGICCYRVIWEIQYRTYYMLYCCGNSYSIPVEALIKTTSLSLKRGWLEAD